MTNLPIPRHPLDSEPYQVLAGSDSLARAGRAIIRQALDEAGVTLGEHDENHLMWLGAFEAVTATTVASWIARAYDAGRPAADPAPVTDGPLVGLTLVDGQIVSESDCPHCGDEVALRFTPQQARDAAAALLALARDVEAGAR
jgi:hypothetical protein